MTIPHWAATHPGTVRASNQDRHLCRPELGLFAVADGVGGQPGGGRAAGAVVRALAELPVSLAAADLLPAVRGHLQDAHERLVGEAEGGRAATTIVVLMLSGCYVACLWAGDSRAYVLRGGVLHQVTADHSVAREMVDAGTLTEAEAERHPGCHVITRAIGVAVEGRLLEKTLGVAERGDRFLLCSDGLSKTLGDAELARLLGSEGDPALALVDAALAERARDNVTALVVTVPDASVSLS